MKNLTNFKAIDNISALNEFNNLTEILKMKSHNLSYLSLGIKDYVTNNGATIIPNQDWKKIVEKQRLYLYDPIFVAATITKNNYLFFSRFNYNTSTEKKILVERKNMEMQKGFIKIIHFKTFRLAFTFSTNYSKFNEIDFITKYHEKLMKFEQRSSSIINKFLI